jgi:hypothetical protein
MHQLTKTMLTNATNASGIVFTLGIIIATTSIAFAHGDKPHSKTEKKTISTDVHPWGQEGDAKKSPAPLISACATTCDLRRIPLMSNKVRRLNLL